MTSRDDVGPAVATTRTLSFGTPPAVGSTVTVFIAGADYTAAEEDFVVSVTDNQGNGTYHLLKSVPSSSVAQAVAYLAYQFNVASSGAFTLTLTVTGTLANIFYVWGAASWTGLDYSGATALDQSAIGGVTSGSPTSLSITTPATLRANELVVAVGIGEANSADIHAVQNASGYTNLFYQKNSQSFHGMRVDYSLNNAAGAQNTNWGFDALATTGGLIATFLPASILTNIDRSHFPKPPLVAA